MMMVHRHMHASRLSMLYALNMYSFLYYSHTLIKFLMYIWFWGHTQLSSGIILAGVRVPYGVIKTEPRQVPYPLYCHYDPNFEF